MEITLIRHGKSTWIEKKSITCQEFKIWVEKYDSNGVLEEKFYPTETIKKINEANLILTSDLKRAVTSARLLKPKAPAISDPIFRETELPMPTKKLLGLKLNPNSWSIILRCLWFSGYSRGCESLNDAKIRAEKAAKYLVRYAMEHDRIVLVGHGFFNRLVGNELKKIGWNSKKKTSSKHWQSTTFWLD
ncbi:histidine phosphatase family protein [Amphibacillus sediminis]|uniref:histidine phosphatase family protein n=1 Tax=Amphibacillus sediminis TaxID=360185 RepID=UPI0008347935|nr:histidine phosphatase family protein [Amphibacillus sediminis]